jgi:methyl-accepting chemotaxis protein
MSVSASLEFEQAAALTGESSGKVMMASVVPSYFTWLVPTLVIGIVFIFFWQTLNTWLLYSISKKDRSIEAVEERFHRATEDLIDEKFRAMSEKLEDRVGALGKAIDRFHEKVDEVTDDVGKMTVGAKDLEIRLGEKFNERFERLKDDVSDEHDRIRQSISDFKERAATRDDVKQALEEVRRNA